MKSTGMIMTIWLCVTVCMYGQSPAEVVSASDKYYASIDSCSFTIGMSVFKNYTDMTAVETMEGKVLKHGNKYLVSYPELEMMDNGQVYVHCFHKSRKIVVRKSSGSGYLPESNGYSFSDLLEKAHKAEVKVQEGTELILHFDKTLPGVEKIHVYFNPDFSVRKMVTYFRQPITLKDKNTDKYRVEVVYSHINTIPSISVSDFRETRYYTVSGGKYTGNGIYKNYTVSASIQ